MSCAPSSREGGGPECVQELVGDGSESPQECIAVEVIDGGGPCSELAEFLDPLFDDRLRCLCTRIVQRLVE